MAGARADGRECFRWKTLGPVADGRTLLLLTSIPFPRKRPSRGRRQVAGMQGGHGKGRPREGTAKGWPRGTCPKGWRGKPRCGGSAIEVWRKLHVRTGIAFEAASPARGEGAPLGF